MKTKINSSAIDGFIPVERGTDKMTKKRLHSKTMYRTLRLISIIIGETNMKLYRLSAVAALFAFILISCGDDDPMAAAWAKFEDKEYIKAHAAFTDLIGSEGSAALVGLGWTTLKMDSMDAASRYFDRAKLDSIEDGYAGWAFVLWAIAVHQNQDARHIESLEKASFVLRKDASYEFSHDNTTDYIDLRIHQAYGYFHLLDYAKCVQSINAIPGQESFSSTVPSVILAKLDELSTYYLSH